MQTLAITHFSIVNSLGDGAEAVREGVRKMRSGLTPCDYDSVGLDTHIGRVRGLEEMRVRGDLADFDCRNNRLVQRCLEQDGFSESVARARERYGAGRVGVFLGTSTSGIEATELAYRRRLPAGGVLPSDYHYEETQNVFSLAEFVRRYCGLDGPGFVVSSACSSTAKVFGNAARMISAGVCDAALVGGADSLCLTTLYGFHSLGLTSKGPCRPYDAERDGISVGEGAGFALVERVAHATDDSVLLLGVGESSDAYHMSTPHPEGLGAKMAMSRALQAAGLEPAHIDYVNLHGTATRTNDASEDRAVTDLFGAEVPCSSTKGSTGHLLGAAGITEAIISMMAITHGFMPGGANTRVRDPALKCAYLLETRRARVRNVLSNSFGFGGSNCSLVLGSVA